MSLFTFSRVFLIEKLFDKGRQLVYWFNSRPSACVVVNTIFDYIKKLEEHSYVKNLFPTLTFNFILNLQS